MNDRHSRKIVAQFDEARVEMKHLQELFETRKWF